MGTPSATMALQIPRVEHEEAMQIAATENARVGELVRALGLGSGTWPPTALAGRSGTWSST